MKGMPVPVFDGHNDVLLSLAETGRSFFERSDEGHIDLPRAIEGGLAGGFCAVFVPGRSEGDTSPIPLDRAQRVTLRIMASLFRLERESNGRVRVVRSAAELRDALDRGVFAAVLHIEGAEAIDRDFDALDLYYEAGLRSIGPVWSRSNIFGHGVPFRFPHSPDTGPGLTARGKELVRRCNELRVMLDLSHLNEAGFWDVAKLSQAPLVATHSNVHALSPSTRNLTDRQLDAVRDSDGMVGVNFHVGFTRPDGGRESDMPLDVLADHVDYLVERMGIDHVGFGSDFDGAVMPDEIGDAAGLPALLATLRQRGYREPDIRKLANENWLRVLKTTWGE
jgi:membrane dipeptidase